MGAWGTGTFDNDSACDWAFTLDEVNDLSTVEAAIKAVSDVGGEYLDADVASEALAACEVLARLNGNWGTRDSYSESVDAWVQAHPIATPADLRARAIAAIDRIVTTPSEVAELWADTDENAHWLSAVGDLRKRVAG